MNKAGAADRKDATRDRAETNRAGERDTAGRWMSAATATPGWIAAATGPTVSSSASTGPASEARPGGPDHHVGGRRFVTIAGQRVIYGSPEYRGLVVVEQREQRVRPGRVEFVTIQGRRVRVGSPEYRRLVIARRAGRAVTSWCAASG